MHATRRAFLAQAATLLAATAMPRPAAHSAATRDKAFDARTLRQALADAGVADARPDAAIRIEAPELADNPAAFPIQVESALPGTVALALFIDRNPFPYLARFNFYAGAAPFVGLKARIAESSQLRVVAFTPEGRNAATRQIHATAGGCAADDAQPPDYPDPPPAIKMRARTESGGVDLRVLLTHPMENGLRKSAGGAPIPERFIHEFAMRVNGQPVLSAELGRSMSQNPLLAFRLARAAPGDRIELSWRDSAGARRTDEMRLT